MLGFVEGDHFAGKPENVRELNNCQGIHGTVQKSGKHQGKLLFIGDFTFLATPASTRLLRAFFCFKDFLLVKSSGTFFVEYAAQVCW